VTWISEKTCIIAAEPANDDNDDSEDKTSKVSHY
jgi:hypothetical protein